MNKQILFTTKIVRDVYNYGIIFNFKIQQLAKLNNQNY